MRRPLIKIRSTKQPEGQTIIEYSIVLVSVAIVLSTMAPLVQRSTQGMIRMVADQVGVQENGDQEFGETGYLKSSYISTETQIDTRTKELGGETIYEYGDATVMVTNAFINLGFRETLPR